jgi:hypothetical protein
MGGWASVPVPIYSIQDVPGKGKGLIANENIPKGTRIISEKPIMSPGRHVADMKQLEIRILQQFGSLNDDQQQEFLSMSNVYPFDEYAAMLRGIFRTNALPFGLHLDEGGIFFQACRINHACDSNAVNFWNNNLNQLTIQAVRDIRKGEEITIAYLQSFQHRQTRQKELWENFKFNCSCHLCSLPPDESKAIDAKLQRIHEIDRVIEQGGVEELTTHARRMLGYVDEQVKLWGEMGSNAVGLARAYPDAFQIAIANGDAARASVFAERLVPIYQTTLGDDSPDVKEYSKLVRNPTKHKYHGMSTKWKTTLEEILRELGPEEFEDWLWKRKKRTAPEQLVDLCDRETFLSFHDLPNTRDLESDHFGSRGMNSHQPGRHWCFLAEIWDFDWSRQLRMVVKDVDGAIAPVFFHTNRGGDELVKSQIRKGHTVVILYAIRYTNVFNVPGVCHDKPEMMKVKSQSPGIERILLIENKQVFPLPLNKLQKLGEKAQKLSKELGGIRTCGGCGKEGSNYKRCGKCDSVWYCNRVWKFLL